MKKTNNNEFDNKVSPTNIFDIINNLMNSLFSVLKSKNGTLKFLVASMVIINVISLYFIQDVPSRIEKELTNAVLDIKNDIKNSNAQNNSIVATKVDALSLELNYHMESNASLMMILLNEEMGRLREVQKGKISKNEILNEYRAIYLKRKLDTKNNINENYNKLNNPSNPNNYIEPIK